MELGHLAFDVGASERPGAGQNQVVRSLSEASKLLQATDQPLGANYVRDTTPLKKGQMTTLELRDEFRRDVRLPVLLGDDNFVQMVRRGIEQGVWVYKSGDLLCGPGDPFTDIKIDNQAAVITMALATQQGIWPRRPVPAPGEGPEDGGTPPTGHGPFQPPLGGGGPEPLVVPPLGGPRTFSYEAPLKEALTVLWDQARAARVKALKTLTLRAFDSTDIFRLLTAIDGVPGAEKGVDMRAEYETKAGATLSLTYQGAPEDAKPVKDFLQQEFRLAAETDLRVTYRLSFEGGLSLQGDAPEKLAERLTQFSTGAALVEATAQEA